MLQATRRWLRRNRTGLAIAAGAIGLGYLAGQYALSRWLEARQRMTDDKVSEENIRRRFAQNQQDCTFTVLALLPTVRDEIMGAFPVEDISDELQKQRAERLARTSAGGISEATSTDIPSGAPSVTTEDDRASLASLPTGSGYIHTSQMADSTMPAAGTRPRRTKVQLWYDMKIQSITRAFSLVYTLALLTLLTRIQLNLLGRRAYLSSVASLASSNRDSIISIENNDDDDGHENAYGKDFDTNRKYLTFSWWLLHRGSRQITERVCAAVKDIFGPVSPRQDMTLESLSALILEVRKAVEGSTVEDRKRQDWLSLLLPPQDQELAVLQQSGISLSDSGTDLTLTASLRRLLDESSDLIESPTFSHVLTLLLNAGFSLLVDDKMAAEAFGSVKSTAKITEVTDEHKKLANTLAVFCKQAHVIAAGSGEPMESIQPNAPGAGPNEYLSAMDNVSELEAFAAVIYSSNFEYDKARQSDDERDEDGDDDARIDSAVPRAQNRSRHFRSVEHVLHGTDSTQLSGTVPAESLQKVWEEALQKEDGIKS